MTTKTKKAKAKTNGKAAKAKAGKAKAGKATTETKATTATGAKRSGTKGEMVVSMLTKGATVDQLTKSLGWQPHTLRAYLSRLGKDGLKIARERVEGVTSYRIA